MRKCAGDPVPYRNPLTNRWAFVAAIVAVGLITGCGPGPTPPASPPARPPCTQPGATVRVPARLIRVLHDGSSWFRRDVPGNPTNQGCRLSKAQINQHVGYANAFYQRECHVCLVPDDIRDLYVNLNGAVNPELAPRTGRTVLNFLLYELQDPTVYASDRVNVYFGGNYKDLDANGQPGPNDHGFGLDPYDAYLLGEMQRPEDGRTVYARPFICVWDGGGENDPPRFVPAAALLDHELGHYFLRRAGQGKPGQYVPTPYDSYEETSDPTLIMYRGEGQRRFNIDSAFPICEPYEIWQQAKFPQCYYPVADQCPEWD